MENPKDTPREGQAQEEMASAGPAVPQASQEETRLGRFAKRLLRWLVAVLVIYALGVVSAYWVRIRPQEDQLRQTQEDLQTAQMTIEELEAQLVEMNRLKAENARLQEDLDLSQIRYEVLSALVDVSTAQIALGAGDVARAKASLDDTQARLERLEKSLDAPHSFSIESMLDRLGLAMDEIDENTFAAMKDLEVLASDLQTLRQKLGGR